MRRILVLPLIVALFLACDEDDPPGAGTGGTGGLGASNGAGSTTGSVKDDYPTVGCGSVKDDVRSCTTTHGPLTQEQIDNVANGCIDEGNTLYRDESCARSLEQGCCISGAAGTRITTCFAGPNVDSELAKNQCKSSGGYWSTAIGDNPPSTGAGGSGAGGSGINTGTGKFINSCYQAAQFQCTGYTIQSAQIDDSCKQAGGVVATTCPTAALRGCCLQPGGYGVVCYYEGSQTGEKSLEDFCKEGGSTFSATPP